MSLSPHTVAGYTKTAYRKLGVMNGYAVQATSVAGVAQRTGATIYYVEMLPETDRQPVFALAPAQGDVDILIAAELIEAGRAIMRGFVTPDKTALIASSHRKFLNLPVVRQTSSRLARKALAHPGSRRI